MLIFLEKELSAAVYNFMSSKRFTICGEYVRVGQDTVEAFRAYLMWAIFTRCHVPKSLFEALRLRRV